MSCSSGFYPMGAGAPLLAGVTTCAVVHWTLCRGAEKHLANSVVNEWTGQSVGVALHGGGWSANQPEDLERKTKRGEGKKKQIHIQDRNEQSCSS